MTSSYQNSFDEILVCTVLKPVLAEANERLLVCSSALFITNGSPGFQLVAPFKLNTFQIAIENVLIDKLKHGLQNWQRTNKIDFALSSKRNSQFISKIIEIHFVKDLKN